MMDYLTQNNNLDCSIKMLNKVKYQNTEHHWRFEAIKIMYWTHIWNITQYTVCKTDGKLEQEDIF